MLSSSSLVFGLASLSFSWIFSCLTHCILFLNVIWQTLHLKEQTLSTWLSRNFWEVNFLLHRGHSKGVSFFFLGSPSVPSLCFLSCASQANLVIKVFWQNWHLYLVVWDPRWFLHWALDIYFLWQTEHSKGFSPVCSLTWTTNLECLGDPIPQMRQR